MPYTFINAKNEVSSITHSQEAGALAELRRFQKAEPRAGWRMEFRETSKKRRRQENWEGGDWEV